MKGTTRFIHNFGGSGNIFLGENSGNFSITGTANTATGYVALFSNTTGGNNTANGAGALYFNTTGVGNTGIGAGALWNNSTGSENAALGPNALNANDTGAGNTAIGPAALRHSTGDYNVALGYFAGLNVASGSYNIHIGSQGTSGDNSLIRIGTPGTQTQTFIAGIYDPTASGTGLAVVVGPDGKLGTSNLVGATGPQGPAGAQGPAGPQGPIGLTGATGSAGPQGPAGTAGAAGSPGIQGIQGVKGDKGDPGAQGPQGLQGATGAGAIRLLDANNQQVGSVIGVSQTDVAVLVPIMINNVATPVSFDADGGGFHLDAGGTVYPIYFYTTPDCSGTRYVPISYPSYPNPSFFRYPEGGYVGNALLFTPPGQGVNTTMNSSSSDSGSPNHELICDSRSSTQNAIAGNWISVPLDPNLGFTPPFRLSP
jgi:hypothetical protein